jgi:putative selenium metabolism protein SsnA
MLITNANVITWGQSNKILERQALLIEGDRIADMGADAAMRKKYAKADVLDAGGQYVMPGNICAHTHFYGAFARGMAIPGDAPKDFPEILARLWWKLDKALTLEDVKYSALACLVDAVKHGTTTLIDHHASPNAIDGSLDVIAGAVLETGLRACLCYEVSDRDGEAKMKAGIKENARFIKQQAKTPNAQLAGTFGLHAAMTLSDKTLAACRKAHEGGFHMHVAEHESDEYDSLNRHGLRVVDRLNNFDMLGEHSIAAHCVHIDHREADLLRETGTWVTHQPRSNMNNAVGAADIEGLMRLGVKVCLGNDGFSNAMWEEWKTAYLFHKAAHRDPRRVGGYAITQMAADNNAALANIFFPQAKLGVIEKGAFADLMFVDYHPITPLSAGNLPWHILFGFQSSAVTTTIASGKVLMRGRKLLFVDEAEIAAKSRELAAKCWKRFEK